MVMARALEAETLDGLDAQDPVAVRSRRDLRRIHRFMGTRSILLGGLAPLRSRTEPPRLLELGAGDGTLMLGVARAMSRSGFRAHLTLLDRRSCVDRRTLEAYVQVGWTAEACVADVFDWTKRAAQSDTSRRYDAIVANLFLHHFTASDLVVLLEAIAARSDRFFACEPRRSWIALIASHLVGLLGANAVTRNDAVLSVRAGFTGNELSNLWPARGAKWQLYEYGAGLFSHCLSATREAG
jgi:hypothetical protein